MAAAKGQRALEEARLMAARQPHEALAVLVQDFELFGAGHEGARHPVIACLVQSKHREGVAVSARYDGLDLGRGQCPVRVGHVASAPQVVGTCQMSRAYSLIVRSDENQPMFTVLRIVFCVQSWLRRHSLATSRWASA